MAKRAHNTTSHDAMRDAHDIAMRIKFADNLRMARISRGLSQQQLAIICAMPRSTISSIETGKKNIRLSTVRRLAAAMNMRVEIALI